MDFLGIINKVIVIFGLPSLLLLCIYIGRKLQILDSLGEAVQGIKKDLDTVRHNLHVVTFFLTKDNKQFNSSELKASSPLRLTEAGNSLIRTLGFDNAFEANKDQFFKHIDRERPRLKYDVETLAIRSIVALSNEPFMDFLKIYFYNNPNRSLEDLSPTLGIYVRDKYLAEHPEITQ